MSRDDEQGVVDADAQTDQGRQRRSYGGDVDQVREEVAGERSGPQRHAGGYQRQRHGEQRTEGDEDDDGGRDEAESLAVGRRRLQDLLDGLAAYLDLEAVRAGARDQVDDVLYGGLGQLLRQLGEDDGGVGGLGVLADLGGAGGHVGAAHGGHLRRRRHLLQQGL